MSFVPCEGALKTFQVLLHQDMNNFFQNSLPNGVEQSISVLPLFTVLAMIQHDYFMVIIYILVTSYLV